MTCGSGQPRQSDAGLTLVEMLVALVLFALVGLASYAMLDAIIRARDRTDGRLAHLAQLDRMMTLVSRDLGQSLDERSLDAGVLGFSLYADEASIQITYAVQDGVLLRHAQVGTLGAGVDQPLISDVMAANWRFLDAAGNWADNWPPTAAASPDDGGPRAVELQLTLADTRTLRRIVELPRQAAK